MSLHGFRRSWAYLTQRRFTFLQGSLAINAGQILDGKLHDSNFFGGRCFLSIPGGSESTGAGQKRRNIHRLPWYALHLTACQDWP